VAVTDRASLTLLVFVAMLLSSSCKESRMHEPLTPAKLAKRLPEASILRLSKESIYFGHQSVGYNILDGIRDIVREYPPLTLTISETKDLGSLRMPAFAHSRVGRNGQPLSKLDDFLSLFRHRGQTTINVGFIKFCYVDFTGETDVQMLFQRYTETLAALREASPDTTFVHMTAPLNMKASGPRIFAKSAITRLLGRPGAAYTNSIRINEFNVLMRETYSGKEPLFDLASIESTDADGTRVMSRVAGRDVYSLAPDYTSDGGHLNEKGRRIVALELLRFLAALPDRTP
jgi:hypothetical protein